MSEGKYLKIAIIATPIPGGGQIRAKAYKGFLESKNHQVDMLVINEDWLSKASFYFQRVQAHLNGKEPRLMKEIARRIENKIKKGNYDAIIGVESLFSYVLTMDLNCLKIFSWESMGADEIYFTPNSGRDFDPERIHSIREMELEICQHSDYIIFPWKTTENYVRKNIYDGSNFLTIRYGCYPQSKPVSYFFPTSIVSVGGLGVYWTNAELLSHLTNISPYVIDAYGSSQPQKKYRLNFKGFAPSLDVLYSYQFGLNTVSKDIFRRNHFSSRILAYLAYGLPVLSPDWMLLSHELNGCLPYNEDNFVDLVDKYSDKDRWEKLSKDSLEQARQLDWKITLKPLERIIPPENSFV
jgi:hypothetical protein